MVILEILEISREDLLSSNQFESAVQVSTSKKRQRQTQKELSSDEYWRTVGGDTGNTKQKEVLASHYGSASSYQSESSSIINKLDSSGKLQTSLQARILE